MPKEIAKDNEMHEIDTVTNAITSLDVTLKALILNMAQDPGRRRVCSVYVPGIKLAAQYLVKATIQLSTA
ncbi:hypothetical protein ONS96_012670 [Cadophora gregata f. sp. sojae]|nr:hypothetical protein ONS96_012670 [Cadophora gregata f. sp. sojae]